MSLSMGMNLCLSAVYEWDSKNYFQIYDTGLSALPLNYTYM